MTPKLPKESDLLIQQPLLAQLPEIDALLFDVDGVLLDVSGSFRLVACRTVQRFLEDHCGWQSHGELLTPEDVLLLKQAGGLGNDWHLTQVAVLHLLSKAQRHGTTVAEELREAVPTLTDFAAELSRAGGSLQAAERLLMPASSPEKRRELTLQWDQKLIVQLFQEQYAGDGYCKELYGFDPEYVHGTGHLLNERVLVDVDLLPRRIRRYGILTGRTREETDVALDRTGMLDRIPRKHVVCADDGVAKPDPAALARLVATVGARRALHFGDTLDDLNMVREYGKQRADGDPQVYACQVLSGITGKAERQVYLEQRADIVAPEVNAVLRLLNAP